MLELALIMAIIAVLSMVAVASYQDYREKVKIAEAATDVSVLATKASLYYTEARAYPDSLADINADGLLDPWNNPYQYLNLASKGSRGKARKDHALNPINSDFDLFSMGPNGTYKTQITQKSSRDDIIRARDGKFIGVAADF